MIRILCADISLADEHVYRRLYEKASTDRKRRADRYLRREDKLRCVTADALLKAALGTEDYHVGKTEGGKPCIKDREGFHFNLSHSGRYVVIAYGDTEVGVDVQQYGVVIDMEGIAERWFSPDEQEYVRENSLEVTQRFYEIWTCKESYLKYIGTGLRRDTKSFSVLAPEPGIRYFYCMPGDGYSLSLCTTDSECTFEMLDVQLLQQY